MFEGDSLFSIIESGRRMLEHARIHKERKATFFRTHSQFRTHKVMTAVSNDLKRIPPRLRDETQIDIEKCIDNMHRILLNHEKITGPTQLRLKHEIYNTLVIVNHYIHPHVIRLPDLHDTSDDSLSSGSTSSSDQNVELPLVQQADNPPPEPLVAAEEYIESEPDNYVPADLRKDKPGFRKYIDQLREELLTLFVPEITVTPIEHFHSHKDLKLTFARILRSAHIYKKREIDDIIVSV